MMIIALLLSYCKTTSLRTAPVRLTVGRLKPFATVTGLKASFGQMPGRFSCATLQTPGRGPRRLA